MFVGALIIFAYQLKLFMKSVYTVLLLLLCFQLPAQISEKKPRPQSEIVASASINNDFNLKDWYLGFSAGVEDKGFGWGARLGFNFRPFYKKTQIADGIIVHQYREQKYFLSLDLDKRFLHFDVAEGTSLQLFAGLKTGFLFGNYKGTKNDAPVHGILAPMGGICLNRNDSFFIKAGYCLFNDYVREVPDSRITLSLVFAI